MFETFKRILAGGASLALVAGALAMPVNSAFAQTRDKTSVPGTWASAILIQNVGTATLPADQYSIDFYKADGTLAKSFAPPAAASIAPGASQEFFIPTAISDLASGQYSGVVSSSQPVKAVVNSSTSNASAAPWSAFAYEGVDAGSTAAKLYFPGFYKDYFGFRSELVIQNTGTSAATVQATFYRSSDGQSYGPITLGSIAPNASQTYAYNDSAFAALPGNTSASLFGVVIEATNGVPLAGVSNIWTASDADGGAGSFNAFTTGAAKVYAAALYNQYYGFVASITVQNLATSAAVGEIKFSDGKTVAFNIPANQAREYYLPGITGLSSGNTNGLLSAEISATGGNIVALVNIQRKQVGNIAVSDPRNPAFGSYGATSTTASSVRVPAIFSDYYGFFTAVTVQNAGTSAATVTLTYGNNTTWTSPSLDPGKTYNFTHLPGNSGNTLGTGKQTGGTVSSAQPLVVVIQHNTDSTLNSYNASRVPNDFLFALSGFPQ
ncbi:MAG: hypothetical protein HGA45_12830 [Chloroflexales bacterium]|nr:hypothetical protein [Chloroflexales bacterium]